MGPKNAFIAGVAVVAIVTGAWLSWKVMQPPPEPMVARMLPAPNELPTFDLVDHTGTAVDRDVFKGQWDLVFFGFTHCPDICPLTLQVLSSARQQLADAGHEPLPRIVLVSVDPDRDTPEKLAQYIGYFGDDNLGITGDLEQVRALTKGIGIYFERAEREDGDYSVDHSAVVVVIDPDGGFSALFGAPHEADNYVNDLPIIMARP